MLCLNYHKLNLLTAQSGDRRVPIKQPKVIENFIYGSCHIAPNLLEGRVVDAAHSAPMGNFFRSELQT